MKRVLAILTLSVFLITYLLPVATLVKADVVIGDNDETIVNENAYILGRKLALMESVPNLLNNGVTELTISNVDDLDEYLDYLWDELGNAVDYLSSGDWVDDVTVEFRNEALENISNYINYVGDRSNIFAELLNDPTTTLLKTYVIGNNLPITEYKPYYNTLNTFSKLSRFNNTVDVSPDDGFTDEINTMNGHNAYQFYWYDMPTSFRYNSYTWTLTQAASSTSWFCGNTNNTSASTFSFLNSGLNLGNNAYCCGEIVTIDINSVNETDYIGTVTVNKVKAVRNNYNSPRDGIRPKYVNTNNVLTFDSCMCFDDGNTYQNFTFNVQGTLQSVFDYYKARFRNVNIRVNGNYWALIGDMPTYPTLDIDGLLKIFGNNNPPQYDIQNGTQIDYDALYDTIYNAIINALPIDQGDITYYDSHDTIYSPTIINNYSGDSDGEDDFIGAILDYAIIPSFDTALLVPIETPILSGEKIMFTGVSVIPNDILNVLGAGFVLILFCCIINRMLE